MRVREEAEEKVDEDGAAMEVAKVEVDDDDVGCEFEGADCGSGEDFEVAAVRVGRCFSTNAVYSLSSSELSNSTSLSSLSPPLSSSSDMIAATREGSRP